MKKLIIILTLTFAMLIPVFAFSQDYYSNNANDTRTLQLMYARCNFAKGKVLGQKIRIDVLPDGCEMPEPLSKKLKTDRDWGIDYSYDYLDFIIVQVWDDNVFNDVLLGEIRIDSDMIDQAKTINFNSEKISLDLTYRVVPGPGYKNMIMRLRQSLTGAVRELKILRKENKQLEDEVERLRDDNINLRDKYNNCKKD